MGLLKEFKEFAMRGNVIDMAVGIVIGGAFGKIVSSLVGDVIMPLVGKITGGVNFSDKFISLDGNEYASIAKAKEAGGAYLAYGSFVQTIVDFLIVAFAIFVVIKIMNSMKNRFEKEKQAAPAAPPEDIVLLREIRDALKK